MSPTRVVIVDDHPDVRAVIAALLSDEKGYEVVGQAGDGAAAIELVAQLEPDLVMLDLSMPVMDGLTALPRIREVAPRAKILVLSGFGTDATVNAALSLGADGFLHKEGSLAHKLQPALDEIFGGARGGRAAG
ncbi:MAG TPA: response regulator transcription factor [Acidimicrobiales bacterium]|nr:response regulator transcription factor [Acidimicrobiales bacterium]